MRFVWAFFACTALWTSLFYCRHHMEVIAVVCSILACAYRKDSPMSDEVKQEERVICKHCGEEVLYIAESEVWIHARGKNLGFTNCCGIHNPYKGIINPGPFAEPAAPSETKPAQQTASVVELPKIALTEEDGKAEEDRQKNWGVITGRDEKGYCEF